MRTYYLNNSGSRWIVVDDKGRREQLEFTTDKGYRIKRRVVRYEQFGNYAIAVISWRGKLIRVFSDSKLSTT